MTDLSSPGSNSKTASFGRRSGRRSFLANRREKSFTDETSSTGSKDKILLQLKGKVKNLQEQLEEKSNTLLATRRNYKAVSNLCTAQATKIRSLKRDIERIESISNHDKRDTEALEKARRRLKDYEEELVRLRAGTEQSYERIKELEDSISERELQIKEMDEKEDSLMSKLRGVNLARASIEDKLNKATRELEALNRSSASKTKDLQAKIEHLSSEVKSLNNSCSKHEAHIGGLVAEKNRGMNKLKRSELDLEQVKERLKISRENESELRISLEKSKSKFRQLSDAYGADETNTKNTLMALKNVNQKMEEMKVQHEIARKALNDKAEFYKAAKATLQVQFDTVIKSRDVLEARVKALEEAEGNAESLKDLLEISRKEKFKIFEACNQLDAKYKHAVSQVKSLEETRAELESENKRLVSGKVFEEARVGKLDKIVSDLHSEIQFLRDSNDGEKPVGWSDRVSKLVDKVASQHQTILSLERQLHASSSDLEQTRDKLERHMKSAVTNDEKRRKCSDIEDKQRGVLMVTVHKLLKAEESDAMAFTCRLCQNTYRDPVTASCGHSFCKTCAQGLKRCPLCQNPSSQLKAFPNDLLCKMAEKHEFRLESLKTLIDQTLSQAYDE